jgi:hypothetical protein
MAHDSALTMLEARTEFFRRSGFPLDGGYEARWVKLPVGPLTLLFPNVESRRRAVRFHDLHHVLTGYRTDWTGEAEISAWEVSSGCGAHYTGWMLDLGTMGLGLFIAPRRTFNAFIRGHGSRNLYGRKFNDALLGLDAEQLRVELGLSTKQPVTPSAVARFLGWSAIALTVGALSVAPVALPVIAAIALLMR